jgi:hypothetical protein
MGDLPAENDFNTLAVDAQEALGKVGGSPTLVLRPM